MNIHRRDKGKHKRYNFSNDQSDHDHQPSSDIPRIIPSYSPNPIPAGNNSSWLFEDRKAVKWATTTRDEISDETHDVSEVKQLCLFVETPSDKDQKPAGSQLEEKGLSSSTYDDLSSASDIDLVLRLGPEPDQDPSTATATKKFF